MSQTTGTHYCYYHPNVETELRCNKCGKFICVKDAVRTPVGYRCKSCVKEQQDIFFTATPIDYAVSAVIASVLGMIAAVIMPALGFIAITGSPPFGPFVSEFAIANAAFTSSSFVAGSINALPIGSCASTSNSP